MQFIMLFDKPTLLTLDAGYSFFLVFESFVGHLNSLSFALKICSCSASIHLSWFNLLKPFRSLLLCLPKVCSCLFSRLCGSCVLVCECLELLLQMVDCVSVLCNFTLYLAEQFLCLCCSCLICVHNRFMGCLRFNQLCFCALEPVCYLLLS